MFVPETKKDVTGFRVLQRCVTNKVDERRKMNLHMGCNRDRVGN